jgi:hypothetical protein
MIYLESSTYLSNLATTHATIKIEFLITENLAYNRFLLKNQPPFYVRNKELPTINSVAPNENDGKSSISLDDFAGSLPQEHFEPEPEHAVRKCRDKFVPVLN